MGIVWGATWVFYFLPSSSSDEDLASYSLSIFSFLRESEYSPGLQELGHLMSLVQSFKEIMDET